MTCFPLCFVPHGWGVNTTCNATQCIATHCNWGFNITVNASCVRVYAYEYEYEYEAVTWATLTGVVWLFFSLQVLALFLVSFYYVSRPRSRFTVWHGVTLAQGVVYAGISGAAPFTSSSWLLIPWLADVGVSLAVVFASAGAKAKTKTSTSTSTSTTEVFVASAIFALLSWAGVLAGGVSGSNCIMALLLYVAFLWVALLEMRMNQWWYIAITIIMFAAFVGAAWNNDYDAEAGRLVYGTVFVLLAFALLVMLLSFSLW